MGQKQKASPIDFQIGLGSIVPSSQHVFSQPYKEDKDQLKNFKLILAAACESQLKSKNDKQFPSDKEVFVFIMQYFVGESDYKHRDIDNMAKTILDILKGRIYKDDWQVKTLLVGKKIDMRRVPQNFAYVAVKELRSDDDVDALKISGLERCVTLYQELKQKNLL